MIQKMLLYLLLICPMFLMAQRGTIKPDIKPNSTSIKTLPILPENTKEWQIDGKLINCMDSIYKCYLIKENGETKSIVKEDLLNFLPEENYTYTIWVKEELKPTPVSSFVSIYIYTLDKIISKKLKGTNKEIAVQNTNDYTAIPTVLDDKDKKEATATDVTNTTTDTTTIISSAKPFVTNFPQGVAPSETEKTAALKEEVDTLKKQLKELRKQMETMQMQIDLQLQMILKK